MPTSLPSPVLDTVMQTGECPLWQPDEAALYWIDIPAQIVHRLDPASGEHRSWSMPSEPGCIGRSASGGLLVALRSGFMLLDTVSGVLRKVAEPPYDTAKLRFNDGRCDAAGRFWVGTIYEPRDKQLASLFSLARGELTDHHKPGTVSNGLAFSPDGRILYHADTTAHRVMTYEFDVATGRLGEGRLFKKFSADKSAADYGGRPDGAAVDSEGAYWCAMYEGGRILRLAPSGEILADIPLPLRCPTMLAFGGADLRTLYITSASHNRPATELKKYPWSGRLLAMQVDVPGLVEPAYLP
jgi:sugar lactone lactonase YvrE